MCRVDLDADPYPFKSVFFVMHPCLTAIEDKNRIKPGLCRLDFKLEKGDLYFSFPQICQI